MGAGVDRLEQLFFYLIERRRRGRLVLALGLVGFVLASVVLLAVGLLLLPLRALRSMMAPTQPSRQATLSGSSMKIAN